MLEACLFLPTNAPHSQLYGILVLIDVEQTKSFTILKGPLIKSHKNLRAYKRSDPRHVSQGMVTPFTRGITTKMTACSLVLWGLEKNPASALCSFERQ
jgi:hypothetical protein